MKLEEEFKIYLQKKLKDCKEGYGN